MTKISGYAFTKKLCSISQPNLGQTFLVMVVSFSID